HDLIKIREPVASVTNPRGIHVQGSEQAVSKALVSSALDCLPHIPEHVNVDLARLRQVAHDRVVHVARPAYAEELVLQPLQAQVHFLDTADRVSESLGTTSHTVKDHGEDPGLTREAPQPAQSCDGTPKDRIRPGAHYSQIL